MNQSLLDIKTIFKPIYDKKILILNTFLTVQSKLKLISFNLDAGSYNALISASK